jgi:predicted metal-dependent peptidase
MKKRSAKERILEARERVMGTHIYFGGFCARMQWLLSRMIPTAGTNGNKTWLNPDFVDSISDKELYGLVVHEIGHPALGHHLRRGIRQHMRWNAAADYVLNGILNAENIPLPAGFLINNKYKGWCGEEVYLDLPEAIEISIDLLDLKDSPDLRPDNGQGGISGIDKFDDEEALTPPVEKTEGLDPETEWRITAENLSSMAKMAGQMSNDLTMAVGKAKASKTNWATKLAMLIENVDSDEDYSWRRPNRRLSDSPMLFPGEFSEGVGAIVIIVDTSGSMWCDKLMAHLSAEITSILQARKFERVVVLYVDTGVNHIDAVNPRYEEVVFKPHGGGGTDFAPGFKWLQENSIEYDPAGIIYLTDMYGDFGNKNLIPNCPVFWVNYGHNGSTVPSHWEPVSTVIHVDTGEL